MAIQYDDVIKLGRDLASRDDSEAALRAAVGRYYYGTLLMVRQLFSIRPGRREAHMQGASELGRRTRQSTRQQYLSLYELRGRADYDPDEGEWQMKVRRAVRLHTHIVDELRKRGHLS